MDRCDGLGGRMGGATLREGKKTHGTRYGTHG
jgi:hypothetical protein